MPNSIEFAKKYTGILDEVYQRANLHSIIVRLPVVFGPCKSTVRGSFPICCKYNIQRRAVILISSHRSGGAPTGRRETRSQDD